MALTKTNFLVGHQCPKALWLRKHGEGLGIVPEALSGLAQFLVDQGGEVGRLARWRFPGGIDLARVAGSDMTLRSVETQRLMKAGAAVLYEAVFEHAGAACAVDVLVRDNEQWLLYEVKAGTKVESHHVLDAAFQYWVLAGTGLGINDISIAHIDNQYVRRGGLDPSQLFFTESVLAPVREMLDAVEAEIASLQAVTASDEMADVDIGPHCSSPHDCPFRRHCYSDIPERSVFDLARGGSKCWKLYRQGVLTVRDIPSTAKLSPSQQVQVQAEKTGKPGVDRTKIRTFLNGLSYPLCHIDFETVAEAIPRYDGMHPYEQLPFQWSVHRQETAGGAIVHYEFLADANGDPRESFVTSLLSTLEGTGSVLVYNRSFEAGRLAELRDHFPEHADQLQGVIDRLVDLMVPFQKQWYYAPQQHGSYSIKAVCPALVPELSYSGLGISDGGMASAAFVGLMGETDADRIATVRSQLLAYCFMDTWAMVKLLEKLYEA